MKNETVEKSLNKLNELLDANIEREYGNLTTSWKAANWSNKDWYKNFLANHYFIVKHTEKLICLAASKTDLVSLRRGLISHFHDEESHEEMLISDLKFLESELSDFEEHPVSSSVYQSLYYDIEKVCPESIIGRICALELMATDVIPDIHKVIVASLGEESGTFLKTHAEEDVDHVEKAIKGLEKVLSEKPEARGPILNQFKQTCALYSSYLSQI
jgi:thiaminase